MDKAEAEMREILAGEYERKGLKLTARDIRAGTGFPTEHAAFRAMAAYAEAAKAHLRSLVTALASLRERPKDGGWLPIDSAPKDGTHIIVSAGRLPATVHWFDGGWHLSVNQQGEFSEYVWGSPTHWRHLPAPPRTGEVG